MLTTKQFLQTVVTSDQPGYFCMAVGNGSGWLEQWSKWPDDIDKIVERAEAQKEHSNVYFSSYLFKAPQSSKENVLPSRTIQADLDNADLSTVSITPSILVETSPGRHQAYWILESGTGLDEHEALSRKLTYSIPLCDRSGWPLGRKVRVPGTINHKYLTGPKEVKIVNVSGKRYNPEEIEILPEVPHFLIEHFSEDFLENPKGSDEQPQILLEKIANRIPTKVYVAYDLRQQDRSEALWALMLQAFKAGLTREEVFTLAKGSANNKFADLKHRADQDLAKDVLRAEHAVNSSDRDPKQIIYDLFKAPMATIERKRQIHNVVLKSMQDQGYFLNTNNGHAWYIRRDLGRPVLVTAASEQLVSMLDIVFGLNYTETEASYVRHSLKAFASSLPETAVQSALGYYDQDQKHLLLHTGRKIVLRITASGIETSIDGSHNVVFPWAGPVEQFTPVTGRDERSVDWGEELFGNGQRGFGTSVDNVTNMAPAEAMALLKVWFLFVMFRNAAGARPIIATLGQPGSGKSTLFKKVYAILYGRNKSLGAVTTMDDFDHATATDPLVILDNVDTWEKWLPDRIALSAGTSDLVRRKLYTDFDTVTIKRQAVVGVTAHNPKFGREDVADRFLLFAYRRFDKFVSEDLIYRDLLQKRNLIWGAIVADLQRVLQTPQPTVQEVPQFRIEDFARLGLWIARAIGVEKDFVSAITDVKSAQQAFSLEEDGLLANAIAKFAKTQTKRTEGPQFYTASELWSMLGVCADDERVFAQIYRNAVALSKKISSLQSALRKIVLIDQSTNAAGIKTWKIAEKQS